MPSRYDFTDLDKDRALLVLACCGGNAKDAVRRLEEGKKEAEDGHEWNIPTPRTLLGWSRLYVDRYAELQQRHSQRIEAIAIAQARDTIIRSGELEAELLARIGDNLDEIPARDLANTLRNVATTRAISVDKLMLLTDRPTVIADKRDAQSILAAIARKAPGLVISDAEEIDVSAELPAGDGSDDD